MKEHSLNSSFREKLIEHLFVGELLKLSWLNQDFSLEVSKPEADNSGYDLIVESQDVIRHIQLKSAFVGAKTSKQNVNVTLSTKQSGCIVWVYFDQGNLKLGPFLFFGNIPGEPLSDLKELKVARHTKGDAKGYKAERPNTRTINKGRFKRYETITELFGALFLKEIRSRK
jgi:hypothetical protein